EGAETLPRALHLGACPLDTTTGFATRSATGRCTLEPWKRSPKSAPAQRNATATTCAASANGNAERLRQHLARTMKERLEDSLRLSAEYRTPEAIRRQLEEDDPSPLYE